MSEKLDGLWILLTEIAPAEFEERVAASIAESFTITGRQAANILLRPLTATDTVKTEAAGDVPLTLQGLKYRIIAGRNRTEAARRAKWKSIRADVLPYKTNVDKLKAERLELDENDLRKDVTPARRVINAQRRAEIDAELGRLAAVGRPKKVEPDNSSQVGTNLIPQKTAKKKSKQANEAVSTGVSFTTAGRVLHRTLLPKEVLEQVEKHPHLNKPGELDAMVDLGAAEREEVLTAAKAGKTMKASTVRKRVERDHRQVLLAGHQSAITGKYAVFYADPPWNYQVWSEEGMDRAAANHYPTMTIEDIMSMPIAEICHDDAALYMWAINPMVPEALETVKRWGFTFRTMATWAKDKIGLGLWLREQTEQLIIATRGKVVAPAMGTQFSSLIEGRRGEHSSKPDTAYEIIEKYHATLSKIELFQRGKGKPARRGWAVTGNESSVAEAAAEILPQERSGTAREAHGTTEEQAAQGSPPPVGAQPAAPSSTIPSEEKGRAPEASDRAIADAAASGRPPPRRPLPPSRPQAPGEGPDLEGRRRFSEQRAAVAEAERQAAAEERIARLPTFGRGPEINKPALPDKEGSE